MSFYAITAITALVGAVAAMIIGFVWYGPLFGKQFMAVMGMKMPTAEADKMEMHKKSAPLYALNFVTAFVLYFGLGFFAAFIGRLSVTGAIVYALFVWVGFIMPIQAGNAIWSGKSPKDSWKLFFLTAGYQLVAILVAAILWALIYPHLM